MAHREDIRTYLESQIISGTAIDWGCGSKPVSKYVKGTATFFTIDRNPLVTPDMVINFQRPVHVEPADHAFCMEVLEHVTDPIAVLTNVYEGLKPGGMLHLSVPFLYPEHGEGDYLRYTSQGLRFFTEEVGFKNIQIAPITDGFILEAVK